jgi:hypothetical protein
LNSPNGSPLTITSNELVENLNAEYISGNDINALALKDED